jgi:chemotaxis protein methyltransferase CheR
MQPEHFTVLKDFLYQKSGLVITLDKTYLLDSRLSPVAKKWNITGGLDAIAQKLRGLPDPQFATDVIEAMTTNETSFFRDTKPFAQFEDTILPSLLQSRANKRSIRVWCAACSSGQEPYSLAMILKEKAALWTGWRIEIVATDLSEDILNSARKATYSQFEVQRGLPIQYLMKYFKQTGDQWALNEDIKSMIKFSKFNLLDSMVGLGRFDVVFCRNVLIYFDEKTKGAILAKISGQLENDGFLTLGGAETVLGITDKFKLMPDKRGLYVKNMGEPQSALKPALAKI